MDLQHHRQRVGMAASSGLGIEELDVAFRILLWNQASARSRNDSRRVLRFLPWYSKSEKWVVLLNSPSHKALARFTLLCHN